MILLSNTKSEKGINSTGKKGGSLGSKKDMYCTNSMRIRAMKRRSIRRKAQDRKEGKERRY